MYFYIAVVLVLLMVYFINSVILLPLEIEKFNRLIKEGNYGEAQKVFKKIPKNYQDTPNLIYGMALISQSEKDWHMALYEYNRLLKINKFPDGIKEIDILVKKINIHKRLKQFQELTNVCYQILDLEPNNMVANFEIGKRLFNLKNYKAAKVYLAKIYPQPGRECMDLMLEIEIHQKNFNRALEIIEQIKNANGGTMESQLLLIKAEVFFEKKEYAKVIEVMDEVSENIKKPKKSLTILGIAHYHEKEYDQALKLLGGILKNYNYEDSKLILQARYVYMDMLLFNANLKEALTQMNYIYQKDKEYLDVTDKLQVFEYLSRSKNCLKLYYETQLDKVMDEIFHYNTHSYQNLVESYFHSDFSKTKPWYVIKIQVRVNDFYYLFFSFNHNFLDSEEVNEVIEVIEKMKKGDEQVNIVVMSLFGLGLVPENLITERFNHVSFFTRKLFVDFIERKEVPIISTL